MPLRGSHLSFELSSGRLTVNSLGTLAGSRPGPSSLTIQVPSTQSSKTLAPCVERIINRFLQNDLAKVSRLAASLLWQGRPVGEQPPVFRLIDELLVPVRPV